MDEASESLFSAELDKHGTFTMLAGITDDSPVKGIDLAGRALSHFGSRAKRINGNLIAKNRDTFNRLTAAGMSPEEAILETWTGKVATRNGFTTLESLKLVGTPGNYTKIEPIFVKP
ncbi:hypothetical protein [Nonomuraea sp. NPDC048916]|uniref:hypothetical protein n=1 Tax=Nonomuraea sp. NPDC048916 TaxID=3154232 RepID=UPI0033EC9394